MCTLPSPVLGVAIASRFCDERRRRGASARKSKRKLQVCESCASTLDRPDDPRKQPIVGNITLERLDKLTPAAGDKWLQEAEAQLAAVMKDHPFFFDSFGFG